MKRSKRITGLLLGLGGVVILGVGGLAYWKLTGSSINILTVNSFQNKIVEKYKVPKSVNPGETVEKIVNVTNTGNTDSLIRVSVEKMIGTVKEDGSFVKSENVNTDLILISYANKYWKQKSDGYFYYTEPLPAGETTKEPLLKSYQLSEKAGNELKGKEARILVKMEAMQADMDPEPIWHVSAKDLGITFSEEKQGEETKVIYLGKNGGFQMTESTTDLFSSFKKLTPGCSRVQSIQVENHSGDSVELYLRAEEVVKDYGETEKQKEGIRKLLNEYAMITITEDDKVLYQGPVSGNLSQQDNTMRNDISLGTFSAGKKKNLIVKLAIDPEMDNELCNLTGRVKWVFTAKGDDKGTTTVTTGTVPRTGDMTDVGKWIFLVLSATVCVMGTLLYRYRKRRARGHV